MYLENWNTSSLLMAGPLNKRIFSLFFGFRTNPNTLVNSNLKAGYYSLGLGRLCNAPKISFANLVESLAIHPVEPTCGQIGNRPYKNYQSKCKEGE
jgi:hypothetical protein